MQERLPVEKIKSLWKETFGDSHEYIDLIFRNYFDASIVLYVEKDGMVVSSLLTIPYNFKTETGKILKGLYLCGLATNRGYRRRGLMSGLIEEANRKAQNEGYDFTFLIPAGELVRPYYKARGYYDSFFKIKERYVKNHRFVREENLEVRTFDCIETGMTLDFLQKYGDMPSSRPGSLRLQHSEKDWRVVIEESQVSHDNIYCAYKEGELVGVIFTARTDRTVEVKEMVLKDHAAREAIMGGVASLNSDYHLTVIRNLEEVIDRPPHQLWSPFYAQNNDKKAEYEEVSILEQPFNPARNAYPFGMVRITDLDALLGKLEIKNIKSLNGYSKEERKRLILRRPIGAGGDALEKILDLPELSLNMSLLLE